jgi:Leucine-rich repeat (LRR) protein
MQNPPQAATKNGEHNDRSCSTQQELIDIANDRVLTETEAGSLSNWNKAEAGPEPFPYYDLDGHVAVFMLSIIQAENTLGYVVIDANTCQVVEFSENIPWHLYGAQQAISIADQWGFSIDVSHPLYLGPFDKYFVLKPKNTVGSADGTDSYRLLLNMMDYSYLILDSSGNRLVDPPDGKKINKPDFLDAPEGSVTEPAPIPTAMVTPSAKSLSVPYYLQFMYGECWIGCTPTAGGTLMGYWAQRGYPNVSWGDDGSGRPNGTIIRLHDLAGTWCCSGAGCTWYAELSPALTTVFHERGYPGSTSQYISGPSFEQYRSEIDQDRPVVANFNGYNGGQWVGPDHSTTGLGYETAGGNFMIVNPNLASYHSPVYVYYGANYSGFYINTLIPPAADSAAFAGQSAYPTVPTGSAFQIWFELTNNGTNTWTPGSYWLQNTNDTPMGASPTQPITTNVAPGQTYRWTINMTAPSATGTYRTQWAASHNGAIFGPPSAMYIDITVTTFCGAVTEIPQSECNPLLDLYNSTTGENWINNTGWLQTNTPCSWYGITCSAGHVAEVRLNSNNLVGTIPPTLENLPALTRLSLHTNQLTGSIPPELGNLSNLTVLALSINHLSGSIPPELGNLSKLVYLLLGTDELSGNIPSELGNLSQLKILALDTNQLIGNIPPELGNLSQLTELWMSGNSLTGSIPTNFGNLTQLSYLNLSENQLTGPIPSELGNLINLDYLSLGINQLSGSIPAELGNLTNLTHLALGGCWDWGGNQLSGSIPPELGNLTKLQVLCLDENQLSGPIPPELGNLTQLGVLLLSYNQLSGPIPPQLGNLTNLGNLYLEQNQLSGPIPPQLGNLTELLGLSLDGNQLTGPIPSELGNLTKLWWLYLKGNHLSGEFPASITNLVTLTDLTFDCWITSSDPAVIAFVENLAPGWQDNVCLQSVAPEGAPVTSAASADFTVTFSEPVTGVDSSDFSPFMTGDLSGASILGVTGGPASYTVSVNTGTGNGAIRLDIVDDDTIMDLDGNPLGGSGLGNGNYTGGQTYAIIKTPTFDDVPTSFWAWGYVERLYNAGITGGCSTNPVKYCPENQVTRGQMAVFLLKGMYGQDYVAPTATGTVFNDVPVTHMFARWIEQLAAEGITGGCGNGNYCPNSPVNREQMAVFLLVAKHGVGYAPPAASGVFSDVPAANPYAAWIEQLAAEGITGGCGGGKYCPKQIVNRAQMAVFLVKAFSLP